MMRYKILAGMLLTLAWLGPRTECRGEQSQRPRPRAGWQMKVGDHPQMIQLPLAQAPELPEWPLHDPPFREDTLRRPLAETDAALQTQLQELLDEALVIVNRYLPAPFDQDFQIWIFDGIPYAAKAMDPQLILSSRILMKNQRARLPYVLAHEIHHLGLMRAGLLRPQASRRENVLISLLSEGIATWLCAESGLFPELEEIFHQPAQMKEAFHQVRRALGGSGDGKPGERDPHNKWGYYAGSWMIRNIEQKFGRPAWLTLLKMTPDQAGRGLVDLYESTEPGPAYGF